MPEDEELERIKRMMMKRLMRAEEPSLCIDGAVVNHTTANFDEALTKASKPVLVDFWAGWCAPCTAMRPVLEGMARDYSGRVNFAKVDVDRNQALAQRYGVMSISNFVLFK